MLGELNHGSESDDAQPHQFTIVERIKHPNFKLPSKYNDIALVKINGPVQFSNYIRPACLPQTKSIDSRHIIASGWGRLNYGSAQSDLLQKVVLEIFTQDECNSTYSNEIGRQLNRGIDEETQLCAGSHVERKDTCQVSDISQNVVIFMILLLPEREKKMFLFIFRETVEDRFKHIIQLYRVCIQSMGLHRLVKFAVLKAFQAFIQKFIHILTGLKILFGQTPKMYAILISNTFKLLNKSKFQ